MRCVISLLSAINTTCFKIEFHFWSLFFQYKQNAVVEACERWLELNLIPQVSNFMRIEELATGVMTGISVNRSGNTGLLELKYWKIF